MSTESPIHIPKRKVARDLLQVITRLEADASLFESNQLRKRIEVLDELDAYFGDMDLQTSTAEPNRAPIYERAREIRIKLEAANSSMYQSIRSQLQQGAQPYRLLPWMQLFGDKRGTPQPGLSYDYLDELISGVLQLREPGNAQIRPGPEMVFYQPTPVRHILHLIGISALSEADVLVDLGSGLGHVPLLASIFTGAQSIGIESEAAYVACAQECAHSLNLSRVTFLRQDAKDADLSTGTVFYLYTPFTGATLKSVIRKLQRESANRAIRVCTLGPCTLDIAKEAWLRTNAAPEADRITCFRSSD